MLLRIYPNGNVAGEISAWSNIDSNHFFGFSTFWLKNSDGTFRDYGLSMSIGSTDTARMREWLTKHRRDYDGPEIPELPDLPSRGPSFVVIDGQLQRKAMDALSKIHNL